MKKVLSILLAVVLVAPLSSFAANKVGVVNIMEIMAKLPQNEKVGQQLKSEFSGRENELKRMGEALEKERTDYINNVATMSESQATTKKRDIEKKFADFQLKQKAFQEDLGKRQREERQKISNLVRNAVDKVAKRGGYNLLIDAQAARYTDATVVDVTAQVLAEIK